MPRTISWGDGIELTITARFLGISHPTGYALYMLLGKIFTFLPLGSIGWRVNLSSVVFTIGGAIVLFFLTVFIVLAISVSNLQEVEETQFQIYVTMPTGSTLEATDLVVADVESRIGEIEEKQDLISNIEEEAAVLTFILKEESGTSMRALVPISPIFKVSSQIPSPTPASTF